MATTRERLALSNPSLHARLTDACVEARSGFLSDAEIDELVDFWHGGPIGESLPEFLGWTTAEYSAWVLDPDLVPGREAARNPAEVAERTARAARRIRDGLAEARGFSVRFRLSGIGSD